MSFYEVYSSFSSKELLATIQDTSEKEVRQLLASDLTKGSVTFLQYLQLLSPAAGAYLKEMAFAARQITWQHFGKVIWFYVPLYLSNECSNSCLYCGFSNDSKIERKTLTAAEIEEELCFLRDLGFQNILLLTGELSKRVDEVYIQKAIVLARKYFNFVALEIFPGTVEQYASFVEKGASGVTLYQETYCPKRYEQVHLRGLKKDFKNRLETPDRVLQAGFRRLGIGALLGLSDFKLEAAFLGLHAKYLQKKYWKSEISVSFPRLCDMGRGFEYSEAVTDAQLVQMIMALRIFLPWVGLVASTREAPKLRDNLIDIGITQISAESKTTPGGYKNTSGGGQQFSVADTRSLQKLILRLKEKGYDSALKDWESGFLGIKR